MAFEVVPKEGTMHSHHGRGCFMETPEGRILGQYTGVYRAFPNGKDPGVVCACHLTGLEEHSQEPFSRGVQAKLELFGIGVQLLANPEVPAHAAELEKLRIMGHLADEEGRLIPTPNPLRQRPDCLKEVNTPLVEQPPHEAYWPSLLPPRARQLGQPQKRAPMA